MGITTSQLSQYLEIDYPKVRVENCSVQLPFASLSCCWTLRDRSVRRSPDVNMSRRSGRVPCSPLMFDLVLHTICLLLNQLRCHEMVLRSTSCAVEEFYCIVEERLNVNEWQRVSIVDWNLCDSIIDWWRVSERLLQSARIINKTP